MAVLTWRNVDAPDFSSSIAAYNQFSNLLGNALNSARQGIGEFNSNRQRQINSEIMARMMGQNDASTYDPTSIINGVNPRDIDPATLQLLDQRRDVLFNRDTNTLNRDIALENRGWRQEDRAREVDSRNRTDAARPILNKSLAEAAGIKDVPDELANLNADQFATFTSNLSGLKTEGLNRRSTEQQINIRGQEFDWRSQDRNAETQAAEAVYQITSASDNPDDIRALAPSVLERLSPRARAIALEQLGQGNIFISNGSDASGSASAYDTVLGNGQFGTPPVPLSNMTVGQAIEFGQNTLIPNTRNNAQLGLAGSGKGSSAVGAYQFTQETLRDFAPKVLGKDWQNKPMNAENQEKLAKAIFNSSKGSAQSLRNRWASLSLQEAERVRKLPWEQARQVIAKGEVGQNVPPIRSASELQIVNDALNVGRQGRSSQVNARGVGDEFMAAVNSRATNAEVAKQLTSEDSPIKGFTQKEIQSRINSISKNAGVNAAIAGQILARNIDNERQEGILGSIFGIGTGKTTFDQEGINRDIQGFRDNSNYKSVVNAAQAERAAKVRETAINALAVAENNLKRAMSQPRLAPQIPRLQAIYEQALANANATVEQGANDNRNSPFIEKNTSSASLKDLFKLK